MQITLLIFTDNITAFKIDYLKNVNPENYKVISSLTHLMGLRDAVVLKKMYEYYLPKYKQDFLNQVQSHIEIRSFNVINL